MKVYTVHFRIYKIYKICSWVWTQSMATLPNVDHRNKKKGQENDGCAYDTLDKFYTRDNLG